MRTTPVNPGGAVEKAPESELCSACGMLLDDETAFRISRAGQSYCCRCYLAHDVQGRPLPAKQAGELAYTFSLSPPTDPESPR
jgi:hypothetical protein